jgi:hypothetical protein
MKFSMSEAWNEAMAMFTANREVLLIVAGIFFFLPTLLTTLVMPNFQQTLMADPQALQQEVMALYASWGWLFFLLMLVQIVGYLSMLSLLRDHSRPTVGEAIGSGLKGLLPAIGTYIVLSLAIALLVLVPIMIGVAADTTALWVVIVPLCGVLLAYAMVKFSLAAAVIALDKVGNPIKVLARSWQLTKGNSLRIFGFYLLLMICYMVVSMVVSIPLGLLIVAIGGTVSLFISGIVSGALGAVVTSIFVTILAAVHRQLSGPSAGSVSATFE